MSNNKLCVINNAAATVIQNALDGRIGAFQSLLFAMKSEPAEVQTAINKLLHLTTTHANMETIVESFNYIPQTLHSICVNAVVTCMLRDILTLNDFNKIIQNSECVGLFYEIFSNKLSPLEGLEDIEHNYIFDAWKHLLDPDYTHDLTIN